MQTYTVIVKLTDQIIQMIVGLFDNFMVFVEIRCFLLTLFFANLTPFKWRLVYMVYALDLWALFIIMSCTEFLPHAQR